MLRVRTLAAGLVAGALLLAGCTGDDEPEADAPASESEAPPAEQEPQTWPLTGLLAEDGEDVERNHPVMVVKIDNTSGSSPQAGIGKADLVVEELVEGGVTRLAVFFHSQLPKIAGPVRSMRASDIGIVTPAEAAVVTSGAALPTIERVTEAGVTFFGEGARGMFRDEARSAPYNLFADMPAMAKAAKQQKSRPEDYLPWGEPGATVAGGQAASGLEVGFGSHTTTWEFRDGQYHNVNSYAAEGDQFTPDTVLVLKVQIVDAGYTDVNGSFVPETKFEGSGAATMFHNGRVVRARWTKESLEAPVELSTKKGEVTVPPGRVWIELMPATTGSMTVRRS